MEKTHGIASRAYFRVAAALTPKKKTPPSFELGGVTLTQIRSA